MSEGLVPAAGAPRSGSRAPLRDAGNPFELARALLDDGRVLLELGRTGEATAVLQKASSVFAKLGAKPWLERTKRLLDSVAVATE